MTIDRTVRSLTALGGASSSRVLNLTAIGAAQAGNSNHAQAPLLDSRILNAAIILKHRLRADETQLFAARRAVATKLIIPFQAKDLRMGGQSIFVGQRGFENLISEIGNYTTSASLKRDLHVLRLIDKIPSLDPFLLREYLRTNGVTPDASYFEISPADQSRMYDYAARELGRLTALVTSGRAGAHSGSTGRMVTALLSNEVDEKLEPLRFTLKLPPDEFREGVFSWRGFIYYKWSMDEFWPRLMRALRDVKAIAPAGRLSPDEKEYLDRARNIILRGAKKNCEDVRKVIEVYDTAYDSLLSRQDPRVFRDFLLGAPGLFMEIGERMGAMSHITSFWNYRFPEGAPRNVDPEELTTIFQDFVRGLQNEDVGVHG